jgi:hypothetical protein
LRVFGLNLTKLCVVEIRLFSLCMLIVGLKRVLLRRFAPSRQKRSVVPYLSIGPIGQLAHFFSAVRQYRQIDQSPLTDW